MLVVPCLACFALVLASVSSCEAFKGRRLAHAVPLSIATTKFWVDISRARRSCRSGMADHPATATAEASHTRRHALYHAPDRRAFCPMDGAEAPSALHARHRFWRDGVGWRKTTRKKRHIAVYVAVEGCTR